MVLAVHLSHNLVNGLDGRITGKNHGSVKAYFPTLKHHHGIGKYTYLLSDRAIGSHKFICQQTHLTLAFALTLHKGQRIALESMCIDCSGAFQAGQLYLGIGKVKETTSLIVANNRPGLSPPHRPQVDSFTAYLQNHYTMINLVASNTIKNLHLVPRVTTIAQMHRLRLTSAQKTMKKSANHLLIVNYLNPLIFIHSSSTSPIHSQICRMKQTPYWIIWMTPT